MMPLDKITKSMLPVIEAELQRAIAEVDGAEYKELHRMLAYHMGWVGEGAGPNASGKRIRPLFLLLVTSAAGSDWKLALPAAAAVELVHNFSLIHDDIQDNSPMRRGRPTVWKLWGVAQAINAGDTIFAAANLSMLRLNEKIPPPVALQAAAILQKTCLRLTQGQYLDISYEHQAELDLDAYWPMVSGKTAALIAASTEIGALLAGAAPDIRQAYRDFGSTLGLAFQALDDHLGIWGDAALTGKSADSDLVSGKKSLPVLYGLSQKGPFSQRWRQGRITQNEVPELAHQLEAEGARVYVQETAACLTDQALHFLESAQPAGDAGQALRQLAGRLLNRQV